MSGQPFVDDNEFFLLMDVPNGALTVDDLKRFRDIGIRTLWGYLYWFIAEPRRGVYDWSVADSIVERAAAAGCKVLLQVGEAVSWAPMDWYVQQPDGRVWRTYYDGYRDGWPYSILSPWNDEAMDYQMAFQRMACQRYNQPGRVQCVCGAVHGGEVLLPGMVECWFDAKAVADFRAYARAGFAEDLTYYNRANHTQYHDWAEVRPSTMPNRAAMEMRPTTVDWLHDSLIRRILQQQAIFAETPHQEAWYMLPQRDGDFAETFETGPRTGNWLANELYQVTPERIGASTNILLFEVFRTVGTQGILDHIAGWEAQTWVGSQFTAGVVRHTQSAIAAGLRGFLSGPVHPDSGCSHVTPEMLQVYLWSMQQWQAARGGAS